MVITSLQGKEGRGEGREAPGLPRPGRLPRPPRRSPGLDLVLGQGLDHLGAQVIYGLHLRGLEGQLAHLGALKGVPYQARAQQGSRGLPSTASQQADAGKPLGGGGGGNHCRNHGGGFTVHTIATT